jgi:hypothetical protein
LQGGLVRGFETTLGPLMMGYLVTMAETPPY